MRTGRNVDWDLLQLKGFGAPALYSDPNGPIHKRAPITEKGFYIGCQWPAVLIKREKDGKIIMVSRQKVRVHESAYTLPLAFQTTIEEINAVHEIVEPDKSSEETVLQSNYGGISTDSKPQAETNMVQSIKSLQGHKQKRLGTSEGKKLDIEESAMYVNVDQMHEGLYTDSVIVSDEDKLALEIEEAVRRGASMKEALLKAIRKGSKIVSKGGLAIGKNKKATGDVTSENIVESKRKTNKVVRFDRIRPRNQTKSMIKNLEKATDKYEAAMAMQPEAVRTPSSSKMGETSPLKSGEKTSYIRKGKGKLVAKVGDLISVSPTIFDGPDGSYSIKNPSRVFGTVQSISPKGIANVLWVEDGSVNDCKLRDLTVVKTKRTVRTVVAGIIALLIQGKPISRKKNSDFPKDFFEVLVREDWRKWVEAVKKELEAWDDNNAVETVDISTVPATARIVPLGELYTMKRDDTYKYRQYLKGNLLRAGVDYDNNFSTTISSTGITVFYVLCYGYH
jgi:hypothetical protein